MKDSGGVRCILVFLGVCQKHRLAFVAGSGTLFCGAFLTMSQVWEEFSKQVLRQNANISPHMVVENEAGGEHG